MNPINFCKPVRKRFVSELKRVQREIREGKLKRPKPQPVRIPDEVKDIIL